MEVFIYGVPTRTKEEQLRKFFEPHLKKLSIQFWICSRRNGKKFANLTFLTIREAELFLSKFGGNVAPGKALRYQGSILKCSKSNRPLDSFALKSLEMEAKQRQKEDVLPTGSSLTCSAVSCGMWDVQDTRLILTSFTEHTLVGQLAFEEKFILVQGRDGSQIEMPYRSIHSITVQGSPEPAITLHLTEAPRFFEQDVASLFALLVLNSSKPPMTHNRVSGFSQKHAAIAGSNLVYRFHLPGYNIRQQMAAMKNIRAAPLPIQRNVPLLTSDCEIEQTALSATMTPLPFAVKYQLQRLVQNGYLTPRSVFHLLPEVTRLATRGVDRCVAVLRRMLRSLPYLGPDAEPTEFTPAALVEWIKDIEAVIKTSGLYPDEEKSDNLAKIYRVTVTPTGVYLAGPEHETPNRVLRKYPESHEYFLRVQFCDEDHGQVYFDPERSNELIYERFRRVLEEGINLCGRQYKFLGFSHSSLRTQACWFMAPFAHDGNILFDRMLISNLGDFSHIRCPAKCAARIGQAFSDTPTAITLNPGVSRDMDDVERGGRVFSDGVGTVSMSIVEKIWQALPVAREKRTTVFQIRYQGAKGVVALDPGLEGDVLNIRKSMTKFPGSDSLDLELCKGAHNSRPAYLNHQNIKILEDMGVRPEFFLSNQRAEIRRLRAVSSSPFKASTFLRRHNIGPRDLSWLIAKLRTLDLDFRTDRFLRDVVETAILIELRALKYKARIPVEGYTLIGVMDETGVLKEGQVFCSVELDDRTTIVTGKNLVVTRSPALHPGDVQLADAVTVPEDSPLMQLRNCICFSQHGERDLPSKLSGGDLDGDDYQIITDPGAHPQKYFMPADYYSEQPVDLGRAIEGGDMTRFFVDFMENDQLGRIATKHKILADQAEQGTADPRCILLAQMHSTAVDFSKSGVPVDMRQMPRVNHYRPDFMAPGPHVEIQQDTPLVVGDWKMPREVRYYPSPNILGQLYRNINERDIFLDIKRHGNAPQGNTLLQKLWECVYFTVQGFEWSHHLERARGIRDEYEDLLSNISHEYSTHPSQPVSELEIFVGNILGKTGAQSRRQKELSTSMRERFTSDVTYVIGRIRGHDEEGEEPLERTVACLKIGLDPPQSLRHGQKFVSFAYIAAIECLKEVERFLEKM